ncbi:hypothetical protein [Belliella pelovolcani]|uniref:hypothetical protein n=1 Tax=Belliella pelovolcani TaxID=529505 RepID=UPI00391D1544
MKYLIPFLFLLLAASCKPKEIIITEKYYSDTTIIREVTKEVLVPGAKLYSPSINIDSLANLIKTGMPVSKINQTLIREDPETKLRVGLLIDELGNLSALCEQQDRIIQMQYDEITRLQKELEIRTVVTEESWFDKIKKYAFWIFIGLVVIAIISLSKFKLF